MIITVDTDKETAAGLRRAAKLLEEFADKQEGKTAFSFPHDHEDFTDLPAQAPAEAAPKPAEPKKNAFSGNIQVY